MYIEKIVSWGFYLVLKDVGKFGAFTHNSSFLSNSSGEGYELGTQGIL